MSRYSFTFAEGFNSGRGQPYIQSLPQELERHTIVMAVYFDVVVDVYPGLIPFGIFIRPLGQRQSLGTVYRLKQLSP